MTHPAHFVVFVSLAAAAFILFAISVKIGLKGSRTYFILAILLGAFSGVHSLYHLAEYLNMILLADLFLLPVSALLFAVFAIHYAKSAWTLKKVADKESFAVGT